ncbi:hypothetical protein STRCI_001333 [Streptomyces cinnabarinus]|uniref:Uncharacterized protein n=1 Tax=Streptomyces cinnabarinus TaxID=67287 RepID=A0ABY7KA86_9ACTN|nr:hypothetical protein [Streptomyces cinnabarinus]WAZ20232.1 hypothetical protein STRCI_001333 [Streptomyces cinnabarinus]
MSKTASTDHTLDDSHRLVLRDDLQRITGRILTEVRITQTLYGGGIAYCAMALDEQRREVPLPGIQRDVVDRVRRAFNRADWSRAQDYNVTVGVLREHVVRRPACLRGDAP